MDLSQSLVAEREQNTALREAVRRSRFAVTDRLRCPRCLLAEILLAGEALDLPTGPSKTARLAA
jgi:hypothetical protein